MPWMVKFSRKQQSWTAKAWARGLDGEMRTAEQYGYATKGIASAVAIGMEAELEQTGRTK